jgi:hypothetical protein
MTLLVARATEDGLHIVGDTKLSFEDAIHSRPLQDGALKCLVTSPTCCVGFAGDTAAAEKALAPVIGNVVWSAERLLPHLLDAHQQSKCAVDFIVGDSSVGGSLHRITDGAVELRLDNAWIGDHRAFESYQKTYHAETPLEGSGYQQDAFTRMRNALEAVISDHNVPSVDGFGIYVTSRHAVSNDFRYLPYAWGSGFYPVANTTTPTSLLRTVGAPGGSYNFTILVPKTLGIAGVGVYILEAGVGALLYPKARWTPVLFRNATCQEFIALVEQNFGLSLTGILFT